MGLSAGVGPPSVTWLPPPVPVWRPSSMNFSVPSRESRASSYRAVVFSVSSFQDRAGELRRRPLHRGDEVQIVLEQRDRRQKDVELAVPRFHAERGVENLLRR